MTASYTKLRSGDWGIRVEGNIQNGNSILVTKKSGETKPETVDKVIWRGDGITLCTISRGHTGTGGSRNGGKVRTSKKVCWETGANCYSHDGSPYCEECGDHMYR